MRFLPSNKKGFVTRPTVGARSSLASRATTGAPPVPVPPPMPAVMNTMSAPFKYSRIFSMSSSAAFLPTPGLAPAPSPLVIFSPSCTLIGDRLERSACASVFAAMNSTPGRPALIIVLTALPPPPPIPTTLILAPISKLSSNSIILHLLKTSLPLPTPHLGSSYRTIRQLVVTSNRSLLPSKNFPKDLVDPVAHAAPEAPVVISVHRRAAQPMENEPDAGRVHRARHHVDEPADRQRHAEPNRQVEDLLGELGHALEHGRPPGDDDSRREDVLVARARHLARHQREDLFHTRLDDLGEDVSRQDARASAADARHLDRLAARNHVRQRAAKALLDLLGVGERCAQPRGDVVGEVVAADRQHRRVLHGAVVEHDDVGRAAADVDERHAELALFRRDHGLGGREWLEHQVGDREAPAPTALDHLL